MSKNVGTFYQILTNYCKKKKLKNHKMATNFHHLYIISVLLLLLEILTKGFFSVRKMPDPMIQLLPVKCHDPILSNFSG